MTDLLWMFSSLFGGAAVTLLAAGHVGLAVAAVPAAVTGWAMARRDHNYKRVRGL